MKAARLFFLWFAACAFAAAPFLANASSVLPLSTEESANSSDAVFRGKVVRSSCFKDADGLIYTRTSLRVDEVFKGTFPALLQIVHRGGQVNHEDEFYGLSPKLNLGEDYLLFVSRRSNGRLESTQGHASAIRLQRVSPGGEFIANDHLSEIRALTAGGVIPGADVTDQADTSGPPPQAITGMLGGTNARFVQPDRGEPIPYLIDADSLPAGMTLMQATNAVRLALQAWTAVTSLKFALEGIQSFGQGADTISSNDEKIRIQLHDNYGRIGGANILGIGGRGASTSIVGPGWDIGGNVAGTEFIKTTRGYVVLKASNATLQNTNTFAEVLCHEIGHALNMAHSSEILTNDPVLTNAIMYFQAHADGRGATLGAYDPPVIQQVYPFNTPPFAFDRYLDVTTASPQPNVTGINSINFRGYDLQSTNLTAATNSASNLNGVFALAGSIIKFTPNAAFSDTSRVSPTDNTPFEIIYARVSDGTNASPWVTIRVLSFVRDTDATSDGIPDSWMINYFGHAAPSAGDKSRATDDADGDGLNNRQEYLAGTNPKDANSAQRITSFSPGTLQFQAKAYDLYEILGSTNLTTWTRVAVPFVPTNATQAILTNLPQTNIISTVPNLPTSEPQMFFKVQRVP